MSRALLLTLLLQFSALGWAISPASAADDGADHADSLSLTIAQADAVQSEQDAAVAHDGQTNTQPGGTSPTAAESTAEEPDTAAAAEAANNEDDQEDKTTENEDSDSASDESSQQDEEEDAKEDSKPFKVERKPLKIEAELEGIFVSEEMEEVTLRPEAWTQFRVLEAVEHGSEVKKGDVLVRFDDERLEQQLAEEAIDQRLEELSLMHQEETQPREERLLEIAYEQAKRRFDQLGEDHKYYVETDRPFAERVAHYRYDSAKEDLASQREELAQLKKMYEADELTEETEEIVLRRQEFEVATAELVLELQAASRDYTLDVQLPRNDEFYVHSLQETKLTLEQAKTAKEIGATRGRYQLEKQREERARSMERHAKLLSDRALMELRSPGEGTVYYGRCVNGAWPEINSLSSKLRPYSSASPNSVLMTIVKQRPLYVHSSIAEKDLPDFDEGQSATISPTADSDMELRGKVTKIASVLGGNKKFEIQLGVGTQDTPSWLVAGMTCDVKVTTYENDSALLVPRDLVQTDEDDEKTKYVMLLESEHAEPTRRDVELGKEKEKQVEVLKGLSAGDLIIKEEKQEEESDD